MADEKRDGPQYLATKQIPRVEVPQNTLDAVLSEVRAMRIESTERFDKLETTVDVLVDDSKAANQRMTRIEVRMDTIEERGAKHSGGLTRESKVNEGQNAAIAMLHTKVDTITTSLAENSETTNATQKLLGEFLQKHPTIVAGIVSLVTTALGVATAWLASQGH